MIRPNRLRIINLVVARARRNVAVRLTLMTSSQSSSRNCTNRLSRVIPALATRISTCPIVASAAGTSASTSVASDRLQGSTWLRSPSSPASVSSTSRRVPDIATVAPCACSAFAIAPPIPPVAPVTRAVLPVRSNIPVSLARSGGLRGRQRVLRSHNVIRPADRNPDGAIGNTFDQPAQHLAGADLEKSCHAVRSHEGHRLAPAHGARDLLDQAAANLVRVGDRRSQHVAYQRRRRRAD